MKEPGSQHAAGYLKQHKRTQVWLKVVTCLAAIVVFVTTYALILPAITMEEPSYCGKTEHQHSVEAGCYEKKLICGKNEQSGHTHTAECYSTEQVLICNQPEVPAHHHTEECYAGGELICGQPETEGHTHDSSCYETRQHLICGQEEGEAHTHTEACYEEVLTCKLPEHTHTLACHSNPQADIETAAKWEKTFDKEKFTGDIVEDMLYLAKSQIGYAESTRNYIVDRSHDGTEHKKGYSRYGAWYGDPYGHWCAMFVSFCLHYAEADEAFPLDSNCAHWAERFRRDEVWAEGADYEPQPGDIIFFDNDNNESSDHVGIVEYFDAKADKVHTIEGNTADVVARRSYDRNNHGILGYCSIASAIEKYSPKEETDEEEDSEEAPEEDTRTLEYTGEDFRVTATVPSEAGFSENAELQVRELFGEEYDRHYEQALNIVNMDEIRLARFFDITFMEGGEQIEPQAPVDIVITYTDEEEETVEDTASETVDSGEAYFAEDSELEEEYQILHFAEENVEVIDADVEVSENNEVEISFTNDSFSVYATIAGRAAYPDNNVGTVSTVDNIQDGITINLFDYYIATGNNASSPSVEVNNTSSYDNPRTTGINAGTDRRRDLQFYSYGTPGDGINNYTGGTQPRTGIVQNKLSSNNYPVLSTGGYDLAYLFAPSDGPGKIAYSNTNHLLQKGEDGYYRYNSNTNYAEYHADTGNFAVYSRTYNETCSDDNGNNAIGFFPFNTYNSSRTCVKNFGANDGHNNNNRGYYNHHFGMTLTAEFQMPLDYLTSEEDFDFSYSGDDDMWVFIDDVLVLDIGGIHEATGGDIDFKTGTVTYTSGGSTTIADRFSAAGETWDPTAPHTLRMFYLERGGCYSNLTMSFNLPVIRDGSVEIQKVVEGDVEQEYTDKEYPFYLEWEEPIGRNIYIPYAGNATKIDADGNETAVQITEQDRGIFRLKNGEKLRIDGRNKDRKYRVSETEIDPSIIAGVREAYIGTQATYTVGDPPGQVFTPPEATIGKHPISRFVNTVRRRPESITVQKVWSDSAGEKPPIQVQLYRDSMVSTQGEQQTHALNVTVKYVWNGRESVNEPISDTPFRIAGIPDGGTAKFRVDTHSNQSFVTNGYITSGQASINGTIPTDGYSGWFDGHKYYSITAYEVNNITSDVNMTVEIKSYWTDTYYATFEPFPVSGGSTQPGSTQQESAGIDSYGEPVTLSADNGWQHTWTELDKRDENGNLYSYYLRELSVEGYDTTYEPSSAATANDGFTVYKVDVGGTIVVTNTAVTHEETIPVEKRWAENVTDESGKTVYLALCDSSGNPVVDGENKARVVKLNVDNSWRGQFTLTLPYGQTLADLGYTIREVYDISAAELNGYQKAAVENGESEIVYFGSLAEDNGIVMLDGNGYVVRYSTENNTLVATNSKGYRMPDTGGGGTTSYVFGGLVLMLLSLLCGYILLRKQPRKGVNR